MEEKRCKKRRGGSDTVQFLKEDTEIEFQFKREELEAKKTEQSLLIEQQLETMFMETQKQQTQLMATLVQKMSGHK